MTYRSKQRDSSKPGIKSLTAALLAALLTVAGLPAFAQQLPGNGAAPPAGANSRVTPPATAAGQTGNRQGNQGNTEEENGNNGGVSKSVGGFTTLDLALETVAQVPACLEYTIEGITLRMIITPWRVYYFWTPNVSHYSPDLLAMSHRELDKFPYIEYRILLAFVYKQFTQQVFSGILSRLIGFTNTVEIAGGHAFDRHFGKRQSVQFSDAMVIGHPVAMLIEAFTFKGISLPQGNGKKGSGGKGIPEADVKRWLNSWYNGDTNWPPVFSEVLGKNEVLQMLANSPVVQQIKQLMRQIDMALQSVRGRVGDSPFCPVNATPFEPYYLSGGDVYPWRMGYPVADSEKSLTIVNPFSRDIIGPKSETPDSKAAVTTVEKVFQQAMGVLKELLRERWAHVYPREGTADQRNSARLGAVVAARAVNLLAEKKKPLGRIYRIPRYSMVGVAWSKMYPRATSCRKNIANTGEEIDYPHDMYAWTVWTRHRCDLYRVGIPVAFVPLGILVTPAIPE